jgi:hypothetical protein
MIKTGLKSSTFLPAWLQNVGKAGFLFFFFKGMLWLTIPWVAHTLIP